jgi:hypothetical protein
VTDKNVIRSYLKNNRFVFMRVMGALNFYKGFMDRGQEDTWKTMSNLIEDRRRFSNWTAHGVLKKRSEEIRKNAVLFDVIVKEV